MGSACRLGARSCADGFRLLERYRPSVILPAGCPWARTIGQIWEGTMTWGARLVLRDKTRGNGHVCFISALLMMALAAFGSFGFVSSARAQSSEPAIEQ